MSNQNDNRDEIQDRLKQGGKKAMRSANNMVKKAFSKSKNKIMKQLGKGVIKIFKGLAKGIGKIVLGILKLGAIPIAIGILVALIIFAFYLMYNEGMMTGVMQEFGLIEKEAKEAVILEDKYWQMISDHSYFQESNQYGIKVSTLDEVGNWIGDKTEEFTPFLNWQADASKTANGKDSSLLPASSFYVLDVDDYKRDYYNRESNYLLPYYLLKELTSTLLQSNDMAKGYPVIYPEQFLKSSYHVNDYMRVDKDGKEFVWIKEDIDGNPVPLPEGTLIYDYKVKEYNPSNYFKAKDNNTNYGMVKSYVYNNLSSFDVKKISKDVNDFDDEIQAAAEEAGIDADLLKALMIQESGGTPTAGSLKAGYGLFQIENTQYNSSTWTRYSGGPLNVGIQISGSDATKDERSDITKSAMWAADHLAGLINRFDGDSLKALQAYNFGAGGVDILVKEYGEEWINNRDQIARLMNKEAHGDPNYLEHVLRYYNGDLSAPSSVYPASSIVRVYYQVDDEGNPIIKDDMQIPQMYRQLAPLTDEDGRVIAISENRFNYQEIEHKEVIWTDFDDEMVQDMMSEWIHETQSQNQGEIQTKLQEIRSQYKDDKFYGEEGIDWNLIKEYKDKPISEADSTDFRYEFKDNAIIDRAKTDEKYLEKNSTYAWDSTRNQVVYKEDWRLGDVVPNKEYSVKDWGLASNISYITDRRVEFNSGVYFDEERDVKALEDYIQDNYDKSFKEVEDGFYPANIEQQSETQNAQKNLDEIEYFNTLNEQGITKSISTDQFDKNGQFKGTDEFNDKDINEKIKVYGPYVGLADFSIFSDPPSKTEQLANPSEYYHFWYDSINQGDLANLFRDVQMQDNDVNANADLKALKVLDNYEEEKEKVEDRGNIYFSHEQWTEEINLIDKANTYIGNFIHTYDVKANTKRSLTQNEQTAVLEAYVYDRHWKAVSWDVEITREITTNKLVPQTTDITDENGNITGASTEYVVELDEPHEKKDVVTQYFTNTNPELKFYTDKIISKTEFELKPNDNDFGKELFENGFYEDNYQESQNLYMPAPLDDSYLEKYNYEEGSTDELGYEKSEIIGYKLTLHIEDNRNKGKVGYVLRHYSGDIKEVMPQPNEVYLDGQLIEDVKDYIDPNSEVLTESKRVDEIMKRSEYLHDYYTNFEAWVSMNALDEFNHYDEEVGEVYYEEITTLDRKNIPSSIHSYFSIFEKAIEDWNFWTFFKTGLSKDDNKIMLTEFLMAMASYEQEYGSNQPIKDEFGQINPKVGLMNIYVNPEEPTILSAKDGITNTKNLIDFNLNCSLDENDERLNPIKTIKYVSARIHNLTAYYKDLLKGLMAYKIGVPAMDKLIEEHPDTWHSRPSDEVFRLMELTMPKDYTENNTYDIYYIQRVLSYISDPEDVVEAMSTDTGFLTETIRSIKHGTGEAITTVDKLIGEDYNTFDNFGGYEIENHKSFANFNLTIKKIVGMATGATDINKVKLDLFSLIGKGAYLNGGSSGMAGDLSFFQELIYNADEYVLPVQLESPLLTSPFGYRKMNHPRLGVSIRRHDGIDIAEPLNTPIYSIGPGKVETSGFQENLGNYVIIRHYANVEETQYFISCYVHLNNSHPFVQQGDTVEAGQLIGLMGSSGDSTGSHLHFGIKAIGITSENENWEQWESLFWEGERWINPYYFVAGTQSKQLEEKFTHARTLEEAISDYGK